MKTVDVLQQLIEHLEDAIENARKNSNKPANKPICDYQGRVLSVPDGWEGRLYCMNYDGCMFGEYEFEHDDFDVERLIYGDIFIDRKSAKAESIRRQVIQRAHVAAYSDGRRPDWDGDYCFTGKYGEFKVCFETEEKAQAFLDTMTEEEHAALNYEWKGE